MSINVIIDKMKNVHYTCRRTLPTTNLFKETPAYAKTSNNRLNASKMIHMRRDGEQAFQTLNPDKDKERLSKLYRVMGGTAGCRHEQVKETERTEKAVVAGSNPIRPWRQR